MAATAAALAVSDELALPLPRGGGSRAVGDLAAAAGVSREEVVVITQCASLGELLLVSGLPAFKPGEKIALPGNFLAADL
uniref:Uncharacterized protein n=1 Tax=Oryza rufipogon TaxID=4529 RepID=A0A0E0PFX2_ORYRU